jgi:hypothetical protein
MATKIDIFDGNIGIGTDDPGNYSLRVDGSIKADALDIGTTSNTHVPIGFIVIWSGTRGTNDQNIPTGWKVCNGSTYTRSDGMGTITTPNLTAKFVKGTINSTPGQGGVGWQSGAANLTLGSINIATHNHNVQVSQANMPHSHYIDANNAPHAHNNTQSGGAHSHNLYGISWRRLSGWDNYNDGGSGWAIQAGNPPGMNTQTGNHTHYHYIDYANAFHGHNTAQGQHPQGALNHNHSSYVNNTGSGTAFGLLNPYHNLYYIMKI